MRYLIQLGWLAICVGLCVLVAFVVPDLFAYGNYTGTVICAGVSFIWFYGNKLVIDWYLRYTGKAKKSALDKNKL